MKNNVPDKPAYIFILYTVCLFPLNLLIIFPSTHTQTIYIGAKEFDSDKVEPKRIILNRNGFELIRFQWWTPRV